MYSRKLKYHMLSRRERRLYDKQKQSEKDDNAAQQYTIVSGDMLSVICRRYYGNGSAAYYNALAAYNGIANPHLIYPGTTITIPPADELLGR